MRNVTVMMYLTDKREFSSYKLFCTAFTNSSLPINKYSKSSSARMIGFEESER
jgi:hypothetical protein